MGSTCNSNESGIGVSVLPAAQLDAILAVSVAGITASISIAMPLASYYKYHLWLSDSATDPTPTLYPPTEPVQVEWQGFTTSSGTKTIQFKNSGAARTWYIWGYLQRIDVSDAITVGV